MVELPHGMVPTKNLYEHRLLMEMVEPNMDAAHVDHLVNEYMDMRMKGIMLNPKFAQALKSDNAHLYMKTLREEIVIELGMNADPKISSLAYQSVKGEFNNQLFFDPENAYNMQSLNNEHAIGFDNLTERAQAHTPTENFEKAHETVFEKLLADYFLTKRGEYKESNKLMNDLAKIFESKEVTRNQGSALDHLNRQKMINDVDTNTEPKMKPETFRELMSLDVLTHRAL